MALDQLPEPAYALGLSVCKTRTKHTGKPLLVIVIFKKLYQGKIETHLTHEGQKH